MNLSAHQREAVDWLVNKLTTGSDLVALRGLAGTGKTTLVPHLRTALEEHDIVTAVGAPTHRAAVMLRRKGISDAETVHSLALIPSFTPDYANAVTWLGGQATARPSDEDIAHDPIDGIPWLVHDACNGNVEEAKELRSQRQQYGPQRLLESIGLRGSDYFREFVPRDGNGCLILDEASMINQKMLDDCLAAFQRVVLIGDPGQLGPIDGDGILSSVEGFELTEIHRQAADSPIVQLAYRARDGERFWMGPLQTPGGEIQSVTHVPATAFLESPLLVYRNDIRIKCGKGIRAALGYPPDRLVPGEPLVCRSTESQDRALGFYNNSMHRIVSISPDHPRELVVAHEDGQEHEILAHIEDFDGPRKHPRAIWFRLGYAITCHTAQGGEWPHGYIAMPELRWYAGFCAKDGKQDLLNRWNYTAITRAKEKLIFVNQYTFDAPKEVAMPQGPPSAPMLVTTDPDPLAEQAPSVQDPLPSSLPDTLEQPDDIMDPPVPVGVVTPAGLVELVPPPLAAMAHEQALPFVRALLDHVRNELHEMLMDEHGFITRGASETLVGMRDTARGLLQANGEQQAALTHALEYLKEGIRVQSDPYRATVKAVSPAGFLVTVEVIKQQPDELIQSVEGIHSWLQEQKYSAVPEVAAFD